MVGSIVYTLIWSVATAYTFVCKADLPVNFPIFHCRISTTKPFNPKDLIVNSPFKVLHISLWISLEGLMLNQGNNFFLIILGILITYFLDYEWILKGEVTG